MTYTTLRQMFTTVAICLFTFSSLSQETKKAAQEGTFQFITANPKIQEVFTSETLVEIEAHRDKTEIVYHKLTENTTAKILPYKTIEDPNFVPLKELYTDK